MLLVALSKDLEMLQNQFYYVFKRKTYLNLEQTNEQTNKYMTSEVCTVIASQTCIII